MNATEWLQVVYPKLCASFPAEAVERSSGRETGKGYDTTGIGYQYIADRLNEVCGLDGWEFDYELAGEHEGTYSKSGRPRHEITVNLTIVLKFEGQPVSRRKCAGGHDSSSHYDALKGAVTNAFKKTAALYGVAASAYRGTLDDDLRNGDQRRKGERETRELPPVAKMAHGPRGYQVGREATRTTTLEVALEGSGAPTPGGWAEEAKPLASGPIPTAKLPGKYLGAIGRLRNAGGDPSVLYPDLKGITAKKVQEMVGGEDAMRTLIAAINGEALKLERVRAGGETRAAGGSPGR
jgi:hypothetical protein